MGNGKEGFGKETEGVGAEEIEVGLDDGEVMIAEMSVDRVRTTVQTATLQRVDKVWKYKPFTTCHPLFQQKD